VTDVTAEVCSPATSRDTGIRMMRSSGHRGPGQGNDVSNWTARIATVAAALAGLGGLSAATGIAAGARAATVDVPGVVSVNKSEPAHWTGVAVAGNEVSGKTSDNDWSGLASPAGIVVGIVLPQ
jgi:hypothetical protein